MPRLLLVEDDVYLVQALQKLFASEGYCCHTATTAAQAKTALGSETVGPFDLMVLDIGLPDLNGFVLCRQLRERYRLPILVLSARGEPADKVQGLQLGADDYLTKPFDPAELLARVQALVRRASEYSSAPSELRQIELGPVTVDLGARDALRGGAPVGLTAREFDLLHLLARQPGKAMSSAWIFESLWGASPELGFKTLAVHVQRVRKKIEQDPREPRVLLTVRGYGYRVVADGGAGARVHLPRRDRSVA